MITLFSPPARPPDLIVPYGIWNLNELINDAKRNPFVYRKKKQEKDDDVFWLIKSQKVKKIKKITTPFWWIAAYTPPNLRSDLNNVAGGTEKVVLDALQKAGVIPDDRWKWIKGITSLAMPANKKDPKVEIWLVEEDIEHLRDQMSGDMDILRGVPPTDSPPWLQERYDMRRTP